MTKICKNCFKEHSLYYLIMKNNTKHLSYNCDKSGRVSIKLINGLNIESKYSKGYQKIKESEKQGSLF